VGPVAETIVRQASLNRCDLIMMGTRGMSAVAKLLLGSCASRVVNISPIPVLLVR
jgi:nucleotide-binding universal stress UspA family protein